MVRPSTKKNKSNTSFRYLFILVLFLWNTELILGQDSTTDHPPEILINTKKELPPDSLTLKAAEELPLNLEVIAGIQYDTSFVGTKLRKQSQKLTIFGYYRLFGYGRNMMEPYPNLVPFEKAYGFGDGYREPTMSLSVFGRPNGKSAFGTEIFLFAPYAGGGAEENVFTLNLGINFYGNFRTKLGNFGVRAGGIHWYNLSNFTVGVYQILDRYSIFDRTPWEGVTDELKYESYYRTGATSAGDLRWNNQAFQGLIVNGAQLPGNLGFDLFWGKTQPNGNLTNSINDPALSIPSTLDAGSVPTYLGFAGDGRTTSNFITGGKIGKTFGKKRNTIFYNAIYSVTALDSIAKISRKYQVHTLSMNLKIDKMRFVGEFGAGSYESPTYNKKWGEVLMLHAFLPKEYTVLPIDVQLFQISKDFFNQNGAVATNSNPDIIKDFGVIAGANGIGAQIAQVGQLVHNRRGLNINTEVDIGKLRLNFGWGLSKELEVASTQLTYVHRINGLALSRIYNPFPEGAVSPTVFGPLGRKISFFRGVTEIVQTTDLNPVTANARNKKYFNAVDLQAKYKTKLGDRFLYLFYLGSFGSASRKSEALPLYNEDSYLFVQYHEFDAYLEIFPKFILTGYLGIENARGGADTQFDLATQLPLDQFGTGIGVGFDWTISKSTGLYFRHRWMNFRDRSFELDQYKGREVTLELKTFF